ncbi:ADP-ribosylation factor-like protein 6-interacting protein 6 [Pempheris klunzingeri]|uniref:ADP-ribosylation factor-like protein 6-interacting protein 6 n=1 Tax=Pempheris klunzingeri TaxID=3127111 RepID=UPI00397E95F8
MRSRATDREALRQSFGGPHPSEDMDTVRTGLGHGGSPGRNGPRLWSVVLLSVLGSAAAVTAAGCFCALVYPILRELRSERVTGQDGTEHRILGFWSILVLSLLAGCICSVFSWTLTYLNSHQPGQVPPTLLPAAHFRDETGRGVHVDYGVAVLNGIMAMLTVIWSLI